jgi:hypothetical protein
VAAALAFPAAATERRPLLRLVRAAPLTVKGSNFLSRERVRVAAANHIRTVRASTSGAFVVKFNDVTYDRCAQGVVIAATGSRGSVAKLKLQPLECAPGLGP